MTDDLKTEALLAEPEAGSEPAEVDDEAPSAAMAAEESGQFGNVAAASVSVAQPLLQRLPPAELLTGDLLVGSRQPLRVVQAIDVPAGRVGLVGRWPSGRRRAGADFGDAAATGLPSARRAIGSWQVEESLPPGRYVRFWRRGRQLCQVNLDDWQVVIASLGALPDDEAELTAILAVQVVDPEVAAAPRDSLVALRQACASAIRSRLEAAPAESEPNADDGEGAWLAGAGFAVRLVGVVPAMTVPGSVEAIVDQLRCGQWPAEGEGAADSEEGGAGEGEEEAAALPSAKDAPASGRRGRRARSRRGRARSGAPGAGPDIVATGDGIESVVEESAGETAAAVEAPSEPAAPAVPKVDLAERLARERRLLARRGFRDLKEQAGPDGPLWSLPFPAERLVIVWTLGSKYPNEPPGTVVDSGGQRLKWRLPSPTWWHTGRFLCDIADEILAQRAGSEAGRRDV